MHDLPIIDAHIHLWDLGRLSYPWLTPPFSSDGLAGDVSPIAVTYGLEDYRKDAARWNVVAAVHVDAGAKADQALDETHWLQGLADQGGWPHAIVAFAPLNDPKVESLLAEHGSCPNVRGIRQIVNWHADPLKTYTAHDMTQDDDWKAGFGLLAKYGLSFDLQAYPGQLQGMADLVGRHEDTSVLVNHAGMPVDKTVDGLAEWRNGMGALAAHPNVAVKISGFGIIEHQWTAQSIRPYVLETIDMFGPSRVMFASDFPTDKLYASFDRCFAAYDDITVGFSDDERRDMFGRNAARLYRIDAALS